MRWKTKDSFLKCCHLMSCGMQAFSIAALGLWNSFPLEIQKWDTLLVFQKAVKTCLFPQALA